MMKEVKLKRFARPYLQVPYKNIQSLIGLISKKEEGQTLLIFRLSFHGSSSVNANITKDKCRVKYKDLDHAVKLCIKAGGGCYLAKSDLKSAFRNLPIRQKDCRSLVMMAKHHKTLQKYYFPDKCTPFGSSISCKHFQRFSNSLEWIFRYRTGSKASNYLDDLLFAILMQNICNELVNEFLHIGQLINFPVSLDKTERATQVIVFLGMLLNTVTQTIPIPVENETKLLSCCNATSSHME